MEAPDRGAESEYTVEPGDLVFEGRPAEPHRKLRRIYDNARTTVEERGVTTLHLNFGMFRWNDPYLGELISPLWLVPVRPRELWSKRTRLALCRSGRSASAAKTT